MLVPPREYTALAITAPHQLFYFSGGHSFRLLAIQHGILKVDTMFTQQMQALIFVICAKSQPNCQ